MRFFCHNNWQFFEEYQHKSTGRTYLLGQCEKCKRYFYLKDGNEIIEGKKAKEWYKYLRPNLIKIEKPQPDILFFKNLRFAAPAREIIENIYATDENGNVLIRNIYEEIYKRNRKNKIVLGENKKPILIDRKLIGRKKVIESRVIKEYQNIMVENKGISQLVATSIDFGIEPNIFEERFLQKVSNL